MKIQVLSDLHLEFSWPGAGRYFVNSLDPEGVDVLILAGDICTFRQMTESIGMICRRYEDARVIWVHGNHEYYGSGRSEIVHLTEQCLNENTNLTWLDNDFVEIDGQRFLGTPLWFRNEDDNDLYERGMNDFHVIRDFRLWVYQQNEEALKFLNENMCEGDIVITHHMPLEESIAPMFKGSSLNRFFLCDMQEEIIARTPKLWIHGHTHCSFDYKVECNEGQCQIVANPRGYYPHDVNPEFRKDMVLEV